MNWWDLLKSPNSRYWEKVSTVIAEEVGNKPDINTRNTISHLFNKLIRENYTKQDTKKFVDRLYESGNHKIMSLVSNYGVYFRRMPHKFLPKMVVDVMASLRYRPSFNDFTRAIPEYKRYENFEGFIVHKQNKRYSNPYGDNIMYTVDYMSNGIIFYFGEFTDVKDYRPFFNKFIKGKTILESRQTEKEKIPLRKIRARGI